MLTYSLLNLFKLDPLAKIMLVLVIFVGISVTFFASRYLQGDTHRQHFLFQLILLMMTLIVMVTANNLALLLIAWGLSNYLLLKLMVHEPRWQAAIASGRLARKTFFIGWLFLTAAFVLLYWQTGQITVDAINQTNYLNNNLISLALILILLTVMTQSAIWPCQQWLISSLNSPTPVSAIMHAGLVNGGGFLLARFAPLYFSHFKFLTIIFILGLTSAIIGSVWKLMQNDIKRMLASSTMAQMGFMLMQCGLGLFPAAIAHLCWHGLFKAYLFLNSNSAAQEKRLRMESSIRITHLMLALICGGIGTYIFIQVGHVNWAYNNTTLVLLGVILITATQFALTLINNITWQKFAIALLLTSLIGALYGLGLAFFEAMLASLHISKAQSLNIFYVAGLILLTMLWLSLLLQKIIIKSDKLPNFLLKLYVKNLNKSQPHPATITTHRKSYHYH